MAAEKPRLIVLLEGTILATGGSILELPADPRLVSPTAARKVSTRGGCFGIAREESMAVFSIPQDLEEGHESWPEWREKWCNRLG